MFKLPPVAPPRFVVRVELDLELGANDSEHALELVRRHLRIYPGECQQVKEQVIYLKEAL